LTKPETPAVSPSRFRRSWLAGITLTLSLVFALAAAEALLRGFRLAPRLEEPMRIFGSDSSLPFRLRPLTRSTRSTSEFTVEYRHNSLGFRDQEHESVKPAGTFRILGLGDSFTYGIGVDLDSTYLSRLEQGLNTRPGEHPRVEVIRAGIPRFWPEPERLLLERYGKRFQPNLVVVGILPNDVFDTHLGFDAVRADSSGFLQDRDAKLLGPVGRWLYRNSHLGRLVLRGWLDYRNRLPSTDKVFASDGRLEADWRKMETELARVASLAQSLGARLVILHIPQRGPWKASARYLPERLSSWAATRGIELVDALPAMSRQQDPLALYYRGDGHCTAAGHAVLADTLLSFLESRKLIP
jgi:hypothetical protein